MLYFVHARLNGTAPGAVEAGVAATNASGRFARMASFAHFFFWKKRITPLGYRYLFKSVCILKFKLCGK
jgi:hypothetical protein